MHRFHHGNRDSDYRTALGNGDSRPGRFVEKANEKLSSFICHSQRYTIHHRGNGRRRWSWEGCDH